VSRPRTQNPATGTPDDQTSLDQLLAAMHENLRHQINMVAQNRMEHFQESCQQQLLLLEATQRFSAPLSKDQEAAVARIADLRNKLSLMLADSKNRLADELSRIGKGKTGLAGYSNGT
jgi:hypothetical protein